MGNKIELISKEEWYEPKRKAKKRKTLKRIFAYSTIIIIAFLMLLGLRIKNIEAQHKREQEQKILDARTKRENIRTNAITASKLIVQKNLKSPSTAEFPDSAFHGEEYKEILVEDNSNYQIWYISSYVDSQNSFGAIARTYWAVKIQMYDDGNTYKILDVEFK
jgi:hypothetical protein